MIIRDSDVQVLKKNGTRELFTPDKIRNAINKSASRANVVLSSENQDQVVNLVVEELDDRGLREVSVEKLHTIVEGALEVISPSTAKSYKDYRNFKAEFGKIMEDVYNDVEKIMYRGDKENANKDSSLVSTKKSLSSSSLYKEIYKETFLTDKERHMITEGDYYIHDMSDRLTAMNCCLFRIGTVLKDGFEMANVWYNEPKTLKTAFDVISDVVLSAASQQYGGFTIPQVDKILSYYAEKSYKRYYDEYIELGLSPEKADSIAEQKIMEDYKQGFQGWEYKFNTVSSSRGDYPFITVTSGLDTSRWGQLGNKIMYQVHQKGQGKPGFEKPVLFPKYVFLYDKELHGPGKELYDVFKAGQACSQKTMYPDWLSLTGEGYVPSMYKQYKAVISPMGCVDGKEIITYRVNGQLFVENFEMFWSKFQLKAIPQYTKDDKNLFIDLTNEDVEIYDTKQGFVKVNKLIRNVSNNWNFVKFSNGRNLLCTTDHPFETENRGMVYAKDLLKTDIISIQSGQYSEETKQVDNLYAWGLGIILCDGCYANSKVSVSIANQGEEEIKKEFLEFANKYYSMDVRVVSQNRGKKGIYQDLNFKKRKDSKMLIELDEEFCKIFGGYKKINRSIPSEVFSWNREAKLSFLAGLIDADGYLNKKAHGGSVVCLGSTNKTLALGEMLLAQSLGFFSKIYSTTYDMTDKTKKRYKVEFFCTQELLSYIKCQKKVDNYKEETHYFNTDLSPNISHVLSVTPVNKEDYSYDVSTSSEHFEVSGIYSHNCRAFLSPYYEKGGQSGPLDETDKPVFEGRFNSGAISLNLPLIYLRSIVEGKDFYEVLDDRLEQIRYLHQRTKDYLGNLYASTNPLAFTQEGFYGGNLKPNQRLKESKTLMESTTFSFGITALDELQKAYNGRTLVEDGQFSLEVLKHINEKATQFKEEDHMLYAIYGAPAESLCGKQIKQIRTFVAANVPALTSAGYEIERKGEDYVIPGVCDREYVSNSFHCNVREDISPIQKQDLENRFWNYCNGGKIQYVRYPLGYNHKAMDTLVTRAMDLGFYEGVNLSLSYCDDCGHQELDLGDTCPHCGSQNLTKVDRMNGYLAFSRVNGESRLNDAKMDEIKDRLSM